ncbi:TnsD family Tn7-like transposition protein [Paenibacillus sp. NPDC056579]|uniref:TnsD family Tn7-like transposition protein n=1 Tax=Paenibacillus sp. NPDC056579 TaxID=3345871 RepID=UPI0036AE310A
MLGTWGLYPWFIEDGEELIEPNTSNYTWLKKNDSAWFSKNQPSIEIKPDKIIKISIENRRKKYLELLNEYPNLSREDLQRLDKSNYSWLRNHDSDWFEQHSPPLKKKGMSHPRAGVEERRSSFLSIYQNNMGVSSKELRRLCGSNYTWTPRSSHSAAAGDIME